MILFTLIFALFLALLESSFLNFPAVLLLIAFLSLAAADFRKVFLISFLAGFFYDLLSVGFLGKTSLVFLAIAMATYLYRRKFVHTHLIFEIILFSFSYKLWQVVAREDFSLPKWLLFFVAGILITFWIKKLGLMEIKKDEFKI